jgi:hypothetical protein
MEAYLQLLRSLPSDLGLSSSYAGPHLARKRLLSLAQETGLDLRELSLDSLQRFCPDMKGLLNVPSHLYTRRLAQLTKCPPQYLSMFCCLFSEALRAVPEAYQLFTEQHDLAQAGLTQYQAEWGVPPAPILLAKEALGLTPQA